MAERGTDAKARTNHWTRGLRWCALAAVPLALAWLLRGQGQERRRTLVHADSVQGVAFSRDGQTLWTATVGWDVRSWDALSGVERGRWRSQTGSLSALAMAAGGSRLVSVADSPVRLQSWDTRTSASLGVLDDPHKTGSVLTTHLVGLLPLHDGRLLVCSRDFENSGRNWPPAKSPVHLWDSRTGREWMPFPAPPHASPTCVAISGDGSRLAWGDSNGIVTVWDTRRKRASNVLTVTPRHEQWALIEDASGVAFSPDGKLLASSGGTEVRLWNQQGQLVRALDCGRISGWPRLSFSPDGRLLAGVEDSFVVRVWSVADGRLLQSIEPEQRESVGALAFSPDSTRLAVASGLKVRLYDAPSP